MNSRLPLQRVAIVGIPIAMASMYGRPQPSPCDASTNASAVRYMRGTSAVSRCRSSTTRRGPFPGLIPS